MRMKKIPSRPGLSHRGVCTLFRAWFFLSLTLPLLAGNVHVKQLRCEYLVSPLGLEITEPRLSWVLQSSDRGQVQTACQVLVASSAEFLKQNRGDLWDSGKVPSEQTTHVPYVGKPLGSRQSCFWKVRVWDRDDKPSGYSDTASWEMGLLNPADWQAQWIAQSTDVEGTTAPLFRREVNLHGKIRRARAYLCGLGYQELRINGSKVGDHLLDPGYTRYDKRMLYVTHDVTHLLKTGPNAIGVMLGNGWFNVQARTAWDFNKAPWRATPRMLLSLQIEFEDDRVITVGSDADWKASTGPIVFNSIYGGETHDARLEQPGWDQPGFNDSAWKPAQRVEAPDGKLVAQTMPSIKAGRVLSPVNVSEPKPGVYVFDFGENIAGFADLKLRGPAGTKVTMKYGERLTQDGLVDQQEIARHVLRFDTNQQFQTDTYILKGDGLERWQPRFVYHGFQYIEVTGLPARPARDSLRAVFIHSAVPVAGRFVCSNPLLNRIWQAANRAYLSNLQSIPTDCPHREKNGWTGDAHIAAEMAIFNYMPAPVYSKWIDDLADEQRPSGELPGIVPTAGWGYKWGNGPAWDSAFLLIPHYLHEYYEDTRILRDHFEGMKRYVDYLTTRATNGIVTIGLGDWAPFKTKTPVGVTSTGYYYRDALIVSRAASLLGRDDDARHYAGLAGEIKAAFNRDFYQSSSGSYANSSQTALSCALYQGLVETENRARVVKNLIRAVEDNDGHIDTGILGAKYLLNVLSDNGRTDVAYRIASQRDLPGWGWWIEQGATTLWEQWDGRASRNHIMFGDISAWFYKALAGINPDPAFPGFKHIFITPNPVGDLTFARAEHDSIRGRIVSDWKSSKGQFRLRVVIPPGATATVSVPARHAASVREGRGPATKARGVTFMHHENGRAVYEVKSGEYAFASEL